MSSRVSIKAKSFQDAAICANTSAELHHEGKETRSGLRLLLTFEKVTSVDRALKVLQPLDVKAEVEAS